MITENIKSFTDEEIMSLINKIVMGEIEAELSDLKAILAEASGRKLEKNYINIIADKIKQKIQPDQVEQKRKPEFKEPKPEVSENTKKFNLDELYKSEPDEDDEEEEDYEDEKYPVLSFLAGLYKVFAWILFAGIIVIGAVLSIVFFKNNMVTVCGVMLGAVLLSVIFLLMLLSVSENIRIKLDIQKNLEKLLEK